MSLVRSESPFNNATSLTFRFIDSVLSSPQILNVPLLLLANKQDSPESLSATEIRHDYEEWDQRRRESARRRFGEDEDVEMERRRQRIASLDVMGVSALDGCVYMNFVLGRTRLDSFYLVLAFVRPWIGCSCACKIVDGM